MCIELLPSNRTGLKGLLLGGGGRFLGRDSRLLLGGGGVFLCGAGRLLLGGRGPSSGHSPADSIGEGDVAEGDIAKGAAHVVCDDLDSFDGLVCGGGGDVVKNVEFFFSRWCGFFGRGWGKDVVVVAWS
jgi:hypothetical protein